MTINDSLKAFAKRKSIIYGVGSAEPFYDLKEMLKDKFVPFVNYSIEERTEPARSLKSIKSILAIGLPYNVVYTRPNDDILRGNMSAGAVGTDYHIIIYKILKEIKNEILPYAECKIFADTGPLSDRAVALRCGLGSVGKNGSIINSKIGGMFFIGYMLTDVSLEDWGDVERDVELNCNDCNKCIDACPNRALNDGCQYNKCISYITQKKGALSDNEYRAIGKQIYGCDICQRVCPYNKDYATKENELAYPSIEWFMSLTNKEFNLKFGNSASGWRGKRTLQRNALAILGNLKDERGLEIIEQYIDSPFEDISSAARYAHNRIMEE